MSRKFKPRARRGEAVGSLLGGFVPLLVVSGIVRVDSDTVKIAIKNSIGDAYDTRTLALTGTLLVFNGDSSEIEQWTMAPVDSGTLLEISAPIPIIEDGEYTIQGWQTTIRGPDGQWLSAGIIVGPP